MNPIMQPCNMCRETKPVNQFWSFRSRRNKMRCIQCTGRPPSLRVTSEQEKAAFLSIFAETRMPMRTAALIGASWSDVAGWFRTDPEFRNGYIDVDPQVAA